MKLDLSQGGADYTVGRASKLMSALLSNAGGGLDLSTLSPGQDLSSTTLSNSHSDLRTMTNKLVTVQRMNLVIVTHANWDECKRLSDGLKSDHTSDLAWVIPSVIGIVFVLVVLALLFYYGVRTVEMKLTRCCYRNCGCCAPRDGSQLGSELESLTARKLYQN